MPNTNCLEGMRCPSCKIDGDFLIQIEGLSLVSDEGVVGTDPEWYSNSVCHCRECEFKGTVADFRAKLPDTPPGTPLKALRTISGDLNIMLVNFFSSHPVWSHAHAFEHTQHLLEIADNVIQVEDKALYEILENCPPVPEETFKIEVDSISEFVTAVAQIPTEGEGAVGEPWRNELDILHSLIYAARDLFKGTT